MLPSSLTVSEGVELADMCVWSVNVQRQKRKQPSRACSLDRVQRQPLEDVCRRQLWSTPGQTLLQSMAALEATSSQSHQQQPLREDARAAGPDLREAAAVDAVRLSGPGGPTYLIVFLDELQTALEAAESVSPLQHLVESLVCRGYGNSC